MMLDQACLIFESRSGRCQPEQDLVIIQKTLLSDYDLEVCFPTPEIQAADLARSAIADGFKTILVLGGDGTVSAVAGVLMGSDLTLGILPRGTANALANSVGIPLNLEAACQLILKGNTRLIDGAQTNFGPMISSVGIGLEARAFEDIEEEDKKNFGMLSYGLKNFQMLQELSYFNIQLETTTQQLRLKGAMLTVANGTSLFSPLAYGEGQVIIDDGLLDITIVEPEGMGDAIASGLSLVKAAIQGKPSEHRSIISGRSAWVKVTTDPPQKVLVDGDLVGETPIEIQCLPQALKLFAPSPD